MAEHGGAKAPVDAMVMPDLRAEFEAWISVPPYEESVERFPNDPSRFAWPGHYRSIKVQLAFEAWTEAATCRSTKGITPRGTGPWRKIMSTEPASATVTATTQERLVGGSVETHYRIDEMVGFDVWSVLQDGLSFPSAQSAVKKLEASGRIVRVVRAETTVREYEDYVSV